MATKAKAKEEEVQEELQEQTVETPVEDPEEKEEPKQEAAACTVFGKIDQRILARREAREKKKAEKQPIDKSKKAAMIGGGIAIAVGALGLGFKALLNAAAEYADEDENTVEVGNCEVIPELPPTAENETVPEKEPEKEATET